MAELRNHVLWWEGPAFVHLPQEEWRAHNITVEQHPSVNEEKKLNRLIGIYSAQGWPLLPRGESQFACLSEWNKVARTIRLLLSAARRVKGRRPMREATSS